MPALDLKPVLDLQPVEDEKEDFSAQAVAIPSAEKPAATPVPDHDKTFMSQLAEKVPQVISEWGIQFEQPRAQDTPEEAAMRQGINEQLKQRVFKEATRRITESPMAGVGRAAQQVAVGTVESIRSPEGLALMGLAAVQPELGVPAVLTRAAQATSAGAMSGILAKQAGQTAGAIAGGGVKTTGDWTREILQMGLASLGTAGAFGARARALKAAEALAPLTTKAVRQTTGATPPVEPPFSPEGYKVIGGGQFQSDVPPPPEATNVSRTTVTKNGVSKTTYTFRLPPKEMVPEPEVAKPAEAPAAPVAETAKPEAPLTAEEQAAARAQLEAEVPAAQPVETKPVVTKLQEPSVEEIEPFGTVRQFRVTRQFVNPADEGIYKVGDIITEPQLKKAGVPVPEAPLAEVPKAEPAALEPAPVEPVEAKPAETEPSKPGPQAPAKPGKPRAFALTPKEQARIDELHAAEKEMMEIQPAQPAQAAAKAQKEVSKVAATEGKRSAKDIKAELLKRIEDAMHGAPERSAYEYAKHGMVEISIPGDGTFQVRRNLGDLAEMRERVKKLDTRPTAPARIRKISSSHRSLEEDAEAAVQLYGSPEQAYRTIKRQIESLEDPEVIERAESLLPRIYDLTKASQFEAEADLARASAKSKGEVVEELGKQLAKLQKTKRPDKRKVDELTFFIEKYRKEQNAFQQAADTAAASEHAERLALGLEPGPTEPTPPAKPAAETKAQTEPNTMAVVTSSHRQSDRLGNAIPARTGGVVQSLGSKNRVWEVPDTPENRAILARLGLREHKGESRKIAERRARIVERAAEPPLGEGPPRPGPGAMSPSEAAERTAHGAGAMPPRPPQVTIDGGATPSPDVVRKAKDFNIFNNVNTGQWTFHFGKLGPVAKAAWDKMALTAFKIRESIGRDVKQYATDILSNLPRSIRVKGGKVFFEALDGKPIDQIEAEWTGQPHGEAVIAAARKVKTRLEEIRTTIRDAKREAYNGFLMGLDRDTLAQLFDNTISHAVDVTRYTKQQFADALTRNELPDDWGISDGSYLTHLFTGNWKITAQRGDAVEFVTRAKTVAEAKARVFKYVKDNPDYANANWKIEQDTVIPADMIRLGDSRFWKLVSQMKENLGVTASEIKQAQQGIIGRKASKQKWFGSLQQRKGFTGYSHDYGQTMTAYLSGFHRWFELSKLQREVQPLIEQVRREGRFSAAEQLDIIMDNLWGKPAQSAVLFDNFLREIPVMRDHVKPLALDRWARNLKTTIAFLTLKTLRFAVVNRLQPLQGLYPLVGERILAQAKIRQHTAEGRALLDEAGVRYDPGQYATEGGISSKLKSVSEHFSGERSNQELAFLAMFQHGTESGLARPEAINYAKLRGQLLTQFTPIVPDIPPIMRGPLMSTLFQFKRFPVKQGELLFKMVAERRFGGVARWLGVMAATGGLSYFMRQFLVPADKRERLRRTMTDEHGKTVADAVMYGAPGLLNTDLSGSLVLGDEPFGANVYEKAGRQLAGPAASMTAENIKAAFTEPREPTTGLQDAVTLLRRFPTLRPIAEFIALDNSDMDVRTPDGEVKYRKTAKDALVGMGSFRSASESNMQSAINAIVELKKQTTQLKNNAFVAFSKEGGKVDAALDAIQKFNERWPEVAIRNREINEYIHMRTKGMGKTDYERLAGKKFAPLLPEE